MKKNNVNLIISYLVLIPSTVMISDYNVTDISSYLISGSGGGIIGFLISGIIFGISKLFDKNYHFITTLYSTNFVLSIIILILLSFKYM